MLLVGLPHGMCRGLWLLLQEAGLVQRHGSVRNWFGLAPLLAKQLVYGIVWQAGSGWGFDAFVWCSQECVVPGR